LSLYLIGDVMPKSKVEPQSEVLLNGHVAVADAGPDPYDPASLRLTPDMSAAMGVKKHRLSIPVRKPEKSWFVRVHTDSGYQLKTAVIELKADQAGSSTRGAETYLVAQALWPSLTGEATFSPRAIFTAVNRQGLLFLWPVRLPGPDGQIDEWSRTALEAVSLAQQSWVRVVANLQLGAYEVFQATGEFPEPEFSDTPFKELLRTAFKDRFIDAPDHPVLRKLRGEI
jgi:hypothetical protein